MDDILESLVWVAPFILIAVVFYAIAAWKKSKGKSLRSQAQLELSFGRRSEAHGILLQALWKANEEPNLEREILDDMAGLYGDAGIAFSADDYKLLIGQFELLSEKGSHKAISEMKKVQALKKELIGRMPPIA